LSKHCGSNKTKKKKEKEKKSLKGKESGVATVTQKKFHAQTSLQ
jgi:hypothetical protein